MLIKLVITLSAIAINCNLSHLFECKNVNLALKIIMQLKKQFARLIIVDLTYQMHINSVCNRSRYKIVIIVIAVAVVIIKIVLAETQIKHRANQKEYLFDAIITEVVVVEVLVTTLLLIVIIVMKVLSMKNVKTSKTNSNKSES